MPSDRTSGKNGKKNSFGRGIKRENELPACGTGKTVPVCGLVKIRWLDAQKLTEGTGFFSRIKEDNGKWWLVDPLGYAFLSIGPDCVGPEIDCRIDGLEKNLDWLPSEDDSDYGVFFNPSM